jgi:nicotinate phosphoribosyltransferase
MRPSSHLPSIDYRHELLVTDLYEVSMTEAYLAAGMADTAIFELFVRKLPPHRNFLIAAGLEQAIDFLLHARCDEKGIQWLRDKGGFSSRLCDFLAQFRFTGDVDALPEGMPFFPDEPIIRVTAPIAQAQIVETRLINLLHYQTLVASKAARMVLAAPGKRLVDFGLRRAHRAEAGLLAARASYIAGFAGTATVPAGQAFGIPVSGTMAHSFVQAHDREEDAFIAFSRTFPDRTVFLLDTYDTLAAARKVATIAPHLAKDGISIKAVRLDSGDLGALARGVRAILDEAQLRNIEIIASGGIDEYILARLTAERAPIDSYGIGTSLVTSEDAPALDCAYKLKAYAGEPRRKRSTGKAFWPGATQVFRRFGGNGELAGDDIVAASEMREGTPLLQPVLRKGELVSLLPTLAEVRAYAADQLARLPSDLRSIESTASLVPSVSPRLRSLAEEVDRNNLIQNHLI